MPELSDADWDVLKDAFSLLDRDGEGLVQTRELALFFYSLGLEPPIESELTDLVNQVDMSGNGFIEFEEFADAMILRLTYPQDEDDIREAFRIYDKENTGYIRADQVGNVMSQLSWKPTEEELDNYIRLGDEDKDGLLSYEEFTKMMTPH
ncbi:neo-calmodulin [Drosophila mojavensis]|uniref:EF-hand domain-containing protein n=2 Tax=Drosophila mojavensis TaxID=7230 RepID=B4KYU4_DROMO|nr:neo-calmodulin [Drosophila mojavensis]EDW18836.1 uncharacterized protein Dmoj_GI13447 [Drosophila mojavensis]